LRDLSCGLPGGVSGVLHVTVNVHRVAGGVRSVEGHSGVEYVVLVVVLLAEPGRQMPDIERWAAAIDDYVAVPVVLHRLYDWVHRGITSEGGSEPEVLRLIDSRMLYGIAVRGHDRNIRVGPAPDGQGRGVLGQKVNNYHAGRGAMDMLGLGCGAVAAGERSRGRNQRRDRRRSDDRGRARAQQSTKFHVFPRIDPQRGSCRAGRQNLTAICGTVYKRKVRITEAQQ